MGQIITEVGKVSQAFLLVSNVLNLGVYGSIFNPLLKLYVPYPISLVLDYI